MRNTIVVLFALVLSLAAFAQPQAGYYSSALDGLNGRDLELALKAIVYPHTKKSYDNLWTCYKTTDPGPIDSIPDAYKSTKTDPVWDMYAWICQFPKFYSDNDHTQTGGINREHCVPNSWWGGEDGNAVAYTDLHHLVPADGAVNSVAKNDYPLGERADGMTLGWPIADKTNTSGKLYVSANSYPDNMSAASHRWDIPASMQSNYGGATNIFEPADEYKGDFARMYLYVVCAYENEFGWKTKYMFTSDTTVVSGKTLIYTTIRPWAKELLLKWHRQDPVSDKERNRNNAVESIQGNRNPFIDYPELVEYIWGDKSTSAFYLASSISAYSNVYKNGAAEKKTSYTIDFESATTSYTDWTFTTMTSQQTNDNVSAHGGSYIGTTGGKATAYVATKYPLAHPLAITFFISKASDNTTESSWIVQVSSDNTTWTDVKTQSSGENVTKGSWIEVTQDLSAYSNVYVRIYYTGSTALRTIDDVTLTCKNVASVAVSGAPTTTTYNDGDAFDPSGLTVTATYTDNSMAAITNGIVWSYNYGSGNVGLSAGATSCGVIATLEGIPSPEFAVTGLTVTGESLTDIAVAGTPAEFWKGDTFTHSTMTVTATLSNGNTRDVTANATFSSPDMSTAGEKTITVTYKSKSATYKINVKTIANTQETAYTVTEAINLYIAGKDLATKVYVKGIVSSIFSSSLRNNGTFDYYISADGATTGAQFEFYQNYKGINKEKWSALTDVHVGDKVIGYGTLSYYEASSIYEFSAYNYLVSHTLPLTLAARSGASYYATFSSDRPVEFFDDGTGVYTVNVNGSALSLEEVTSKQVPANTGVLLKSTSSAPSCEIVSSAALSYVDNAAHTNLLYPGTGETISTPANCKYYKLAFASGTYDSAKGTGSNLGFYYGATGGAAYTASKGLAYLAVPNPSQGSKDAPTHFLFEDSEEGEEIATDLNAVNPGDASVSTDASVVKFFDNGQLYILKDGAVYNIFGQHVR